MNTRILVSRGTDDPSERTPEYNIFENLDVQPAFEVIKACRNSGTPVSFRLSGPDAPAGLEVLKDLFGTQFDEMALNMLYFSAGAALGKVHRAGQLVRAGVSAELLRKALEPPAGEVEDDGQQE